VNLVDYRESTPDKAARALLRLRGDAHPEHRCAGAIRHPESLAFERRFDRLNLDESHYLNRNDICTPMGCVRDMVDSIPAAFWRRKDLEVLDPCAGNGNFHAYIKNFAPLHRLAFNEINEARIANIRRLFGKGARITRRDFLKYDESRQFDLIVSNPPYAMYDSNGNRVSKNHNLSRAFIEKALRLTKPGGLMLFIVPNNWMSLSDRNILPASLSRYQFLHLNIHGAKHWFPGVGSSFTWFLLKKSPNKKKFTVENHYLQQDVVRASLRPGSDFIPLYYSDTVAGIFHKCLNGRAERQGVLTSSDLHAYTKSSFLSPKRTKNHIHKTIHTPTKTMWSTKPHKHQKGWKVFLSLTNSYQAFVDDCGMTQSVAYIRCKSKTEAQARKMELEAPIYRFLNDLTRYGNFNNVRILQRFPRLKDVRLTKRERAVVNRHWERCHGR